MKPEVVRVPPGLLLDRHLSSTAKVIWMLVKLQTQSAERQDAAHLGARRRGAPAPIRRPEAGIGPLRHAGRPDGQTLPELGAAGAVHARHPGQRGGPESPGLPEAGTGPVRQARLRVGPAAPGLLQDRSGLARNTILAGLSRLTASGWLPLPNGPEATSQHLAHTGHAELPSDLLLDKRLEVRDKLLYGALQLTPGFRMPDGQCTTAQLSALTGLCPNTVRAALGSLQTAGWLRTVHRSRQSPMAFELLNPAAAQRLAAVARAEQRLTEAQFKGEAIMREYLTLIVDRDEFDDDASPGFLINPYTEEELQLDRFYPPDVAFEFQGAQHYGATDRFPSTPKARRQMARDLIKLGICVERSITLVLVHADDLSLEGILGKVTGLLPLRNLEQSGPLIEYLEKVSAGYRKRARRGRAATKAT